MRLVEVFVIGFSIFNVGWSENFSIHRLAFGSCFNPPKGGRIWKLIESFHPNHLVLLGDSIYADKPVGYYDDNTPAVIAHDYNLLTNNSDWKSLMKSLTDWSVTFDDHDYGVNNGDKTFPHRNISQQLFFQFAHSSFKGVDYTKRNGVYSSKVIRVRHGFEAPDFVYKLILLDCRSNKDPRGTIDGDFLGEEQWQWLIRELSDPEVPDLILLGSGIQVLSDDKLVEESWSEFPRARTRLLKLITAAALTTNVIILSGDIHKAEVSQATCALTTKRAPSPSVSLSSPIATMDQNATTMRMLTDGMGLWEFTSSGLSHTFHQRTARRRYDSDIKTMKRRRARAAALKAGMDNIIYGNTRQPVQVEPHDMNDEEAANHTTNSMMNTTTNHQATLGKHGVINTEEDSEDDDSTDASSSMKEGDIFVQVAHRGFIYELIDRVYQYAYPAHYRQDKVADVYDEIHFGLFDVVITNEDLGSISSSNGSSRTDNNSTSTSSLQYNIVFRIISHNSATVIMKTIPLLSLQEKRAQLATTKVGRLATDIRGKLNNNSLPMTDATTAINNQDVTAPPLLFDPSFLPYLLNDNNVAAAQGSSSDDDVTIVEVECIPYWGPVSWQKNLSMRAIIAAALLGTVVLPLLLVLWLIGASIYYICFYKELTRREKLLRHYKTYKRE